MRPYRKVSNLRSLPRSNSRREPGIAGCLRHAGCRGIGQDRFVQVSQRGSHVKLRKAERVAIVPLHRELASGTLSSVLHQAGLSRDEFVALL